MDALGRVWIVVKEAVDGLKTLGVALVFVLLGLADYYDVVNVRPMLEALFGMDRAAKIMIYLPIVFATLRFLSNSAPRWSKQWREQRQDRLQRVDDPDCTPKQEGGQ